MKKAKYLLLLVSTMIIVSCSKDMKVVKQLDGSWKVTSWTEDGVAAPAAEYENMTYNFTKCKVKKEDCDGSITDGSTSMPFTYRVTEKGEKITMTYNFLGVNFSETADIEEHSKTKFVISSVEDGVKTVITMEKK
jgi:hypothetical protein